MQSQMAVAGNEEFDFEAAEEEVPLAQMKKTFAPEEVAVEKMLDGGENGHNGNDLDTSKSDIYTELFGEPQTKVNGKEKDKEPKKKSKAGPKSKKPKEANENGDEGTSEVKNGDGKLREIEDVLADFEADDVVESEEVKEEVTEQITEVQMEDVSVTQIEVPVSPTAFLSQTEPSQVAEDSFKSTTTTTTTSDSPILSRKTRSTREQTDTVSEQNDTVHEQPKTDYSKPFVRYLTASARPPLHAASTWTPYKPAEPVVIVKQTSPSIFNFFKRNKTASPLKESIPTTSAVKRKADCIDIADEETAKKAKSAGLFSLITSPVISRFRGVSSSTPLGGKRDEGCVLDAGDVSGIEVDAEVVEGKEELPVELAKTADQTQQWCVLM